jgi:hypothetical protein
MATTELTAEEIAALQAENKKIKAANAQLETAKEKLTADLAKQKEAAAALATENNALTNQNITLSKLVELQKSEIDSAEQLNDELQAQLDVKGGNELSLTFELDGDSYKAVHSVYIPGDREYSAADIAANQDLQRKLIEQQSSAIEQVTETE